MSLADVRRSLEGELDYMGQVNFCLRESDRALSGPSLSKLLNELSNDAFRALVIGFEPLAQEALDR
jgi:hypothetical protein